MGYSGPQVSERGVQVLDSHMLVARNAVVIFLRFLEVASKVIIQLFWIECCRLMIVGSFGSQRCFTFYLGPQVSERDMRLLVLHLRVVRIVAIIFLDFFEVISQVKNNHFLDWLRGERQIMDYEINCAPCGLSVTPRGWG